jgi:hypothetical protein
MSNITLPESIVVVRFSENHISVVASNQATERLEVDLTSRTWKSWRGIVRKFGEADVPGSEYVRGNMTIGVYDVRDLAQLQALISTVEQIARESGRSSIHD